MDEYANAPTIVVVADGAELNQLAMRLEPWAESGGSLVLQSDDSLREGVAVSIVLEPDQRARGTELLSRDESQARLAWRLNAEAATEVAEKVKRLAESAGPGHQYLGVHAGEDVRIMVSKNEAEWERLFVVSRG